MLFSYNWLQSFFKQKLPAPEKLAEFLTLHFAEVEGTKKTGDDFVLDIDIRPNRAADCLSHIGVAREIAAILNYKLPAFASASAGKQIIEDRNLKTKDFIVVEVKSGKTCPRYTARVVNNVKVFPSPKWLQERLVSCGLRPINNIVDATNYVMLETGQPLHAFDAEKIEGKQIVVRSAKKGEKITTLDGENYDLDKNILVISDKESPLAIAGIKGGKKAEIASKTKIIILESANFNSRIVRFASKEIDLKTDASLRFEHGLDPSLAEFAAARAISLIQKLAGGKIASGLIDVYPKKVLPKIVKLNLDYVKSLLGVEIPETKIKRILESLGFKIPAFAKASAGKKNLRVLEVEIPTRRVDINLPADLVEEIGRIYGYKNIPEVLPSVSLAPVKRNLNISREDAARNFLKESGFNEIYNYSFVSEKDLEVFKLNKKDLKELENSLSPDFQYLRPSLIPNLLKNIERNQKNYKEIKIFELGKIFGKNMEKTMLVGAMTGDKFYEAKGVVDALLQKMGINNIRYAEYQAKSEELKSFICYPERTAEIMADNEKIGFLGEILPRVQAAYKVDSPVVLFDIDFEKLIKLASETKKYRPISRFPLAARDVAVLVPKSVKVGDVLNEISNVDVGLIRDVDLFDIYKGDNLPPGKKNLAFHIIFQAEDKTLSPKEIDDLQNKIINALEKNPGWQVRK